TLFVSSSKSGSTLETRSHTDYFWEKAGKRGNRFAAITDPGSELEHLARERGFRATFYGEPSIGGRYSALSPFGIVPAVLLGADERRGARVSRDQPVRPARRPGGEGQDERGAGYGEGTGARAGGLGRRAARPGPGERLLLYPGVRRAGPGR